MVALKPLNGTWEEANDEAVGRNLEAITCERERMAQLQNMEGDAFLKMETGAIPIGEDRSPFMIPMNSSRNGGWGEGKRKYKDKRVRCDWCALQRYILAGAIFSFIIWVFPLTYREFGTQ